MSVADLARFAVAVVICSIGVAAVVGHAVRPQPKDRLLLWVGAFTLCYGVRLLLSIGPVAGLSASPDQAALAIAAFNYGIHVPAILFLEELYGRGWRGAMRWLAVVAGAYAGIGVAVDVLAGNPQLAPDPALILIGPGLGLVWLAGLVSGYRPKPFPEWRVLVGGFGVFLAFVVHEHAVSAGLVPWTLHVEPLGMLLFNGCLGYIAVSRFFSTERQLIEIDKEMDAARRIQASILPGHLPSAPGIEIAVRYVPLAAVAGDFYDVIRRADGTLVVLVADVSGHGVPAALIASMVKVSFAAATAGTGDPAAILEGMNRTLCGMFDRAYVTAVCATLDTPSHAIRYAIAGHPPPLVVSSGGAVQRLDERGMFIGMFPSAAFTTATVTFDGPARLILYTDGVTEAAHPPTDDLYGLERLSAAASAHAGHSAAGFADAVLAELSAFAGRRQLPHDDVTLIVVDITPSA